jgi:alanyl-tRNA synthetase
MTDQEPTQFAEIERLTAMLEETQTRHARELNKLRQETIQDIDQSKYKIGREQINDLHASMSETLSKTIEETQEKTRKELADALLAPNSNHPEDVRHYRASIDLVESAGKDNAKIEELIHRALKYKDNTLARLLVRVHCGDQNHKLMHQALAQVDKTVRATYDYESKYGDYVKQGVPKVWAGWQTYDSKERFPDIPGRPDHLQPRALHEQRMAKLQNKT